MGVCFVFDDSLITQACEVLLSRDYRMMDTSRRSAVHSCPHMVDHFYCCAPETGQTCSQWTLLHLLPDHALSP